MGKIKVVSTVPPVAYDFAPLEKLVARGWYKFNEDGRWANTGSSPYVDLYWGVRLLDRRFPVHESLSAVFCELARTIAEIYPERVNCQIESSYDARFVLFEFNDHPLTTHTDCAAGNKGSRRTEIRLKVAAFIGLRQPVPRSDGVETPGRLNTVDVAV